jgi:hypothetical protein
VKSGIGKNFFCTVLLSLQSITTILWVIMKVMLAMCLLYLTLFWSGQGKEFIAEVLQQMICSYWPFLEHLREMYVHLEEVENIIIHYLKLNFIMTLTQWVVMMIVTLHFVGTLIPPHFHGDDRKQALLTPRES